MSLKTETKTDIFTKALARQEQGLKTYGEFKPETDKRNLYEEIENELLDVINYAYFEILKIRKLKRKAELNG